MRPIAWRRRQRGQVLPISAICAGVLLGGAALAVDLSVATTNHRNLQNATDAAALSAARDLGASNGGQANQADRLQGAVDALRVVYDHMGWGSSGTTWATGVVHAQTGQNCGNGAAATHCDVTTSGPGAGSGVTVTVDIPPLSAPNPAYDERPGAPGLPWGYVEVDVTDPAAAGLGGAIGLHMGPTGSRSVAYHLPAAQPFGFALYSNTLVTGGNQGEVIDGNVYAYRDINPQSGGHSGFCAGPDANGNLGAIVLGSPQSGSFPSPDPAAGSPYQSNVRPTAADTVQAVSSCSVATGSGTVNQTANLGACGTLSVQGVTLTAVQDPSSQACMASPALLPPDLQGPSLSGNVVTEDGSALGNNRSVLTVTSALTPGLYYVTHNPNCSPPNCTDVVIDGHSAPSNCTGAYASSYTTCLVGVTFWLDQGATIGVTNGAHVLISPYQPPSGQTEDPNDGFYSVYAPTGSAGGLYESNVSSSLTVTGTVYLPSGTLSAGQNARLSIDGQAIVDTWNVQSGNFTNPEVTFDPRYVAKLREQLQLVQ